LSPMRETIAINILTGGKSWNTVISRDTKNIACEEREKWASKNPAFGSSWYHPNMTECPGHKRKSQELWLSNAQPGPHHNQGLLKESSKQTLCGGVIFFNSLNQCLVNVNHWSMLFDHCFIVICIYIHINCFIVIYTHIYNVIHIYHKIYHFDHLSVQLNGIKPIHVILQPTPLSISKNFCSSSILIKQYSPFCYPSISSYLYPLSLWIYLLSDTCASPTWTHTVLSFRHWLI
jgi:hypothetical protein